jgi:hypothetical protein
VRSKGFAVSPPVSVNEIDMRGANMARFTQTALKFVKAVEDAVSGAGGSIMISGLLPVKVNFGLRSDISTG